MQKILAALSKGPLTAEAIHEQTMIPVKEILAKCATDHRTTVDTTVRPYLVTSLEVTKKHGRKE